MRSILLIIALFGILQLGGCATPFVSGRVVQETVYNPGYYGYRGGRFPAGRGFYRPRFIGGAYYRGSFGGGHRHGFGHRHPAGRGHVGRHQHYPNQMQPQHNHGGGHRHPGGGGGRHFDGQNHGGGHQGGGSPRHFDGEGGRGR